MGRAPRRSVEEWLGLVSTPDDRRWLLARSEYLRIHYGDEDFETRRVEVEPFCLEPARRPNKDWPPRGARFDGIEGRVLSLWHQGGDDALDRHAELAELGLAEVADFRKRDRPAAKSISAPLREYSGRLRAIRDQPELRVFIRQ